MKERRTSSSGARGWKTLAGLLAGVVVIGVSCIAATPVHAVGTVWAWGYNDAGQLGNGSNARSDVPVAVSNLTDATAVAAGADDSLALKSDGTVWAWGDNDFGQLGNGTSTNSNVPVQVRNLTGVIAVAAGESHSLALKNDGTVWAWGLNFYGELGNGTGTDSNVPVQVSNLTGVTAVAAGNSHSLAVKGDGTVWAWGNNEYGQFGTGNVTYSNVPIQVNNLTGVIAVAAGNSHTLAVKGDGTVWAWGYNGWGQLGSGSNTDSSVPVQVTNLTGVIAVAAAATGFHSLALKSDGAVWAWGSNYWGELGNGSKDWTGSNVPVQVSNLTGVVAIAGGWMYSLALKSDGTVWAWGVNVVDGELSNGDITYSNVPVVVSSLTGAIAVAAGMHHRLTISGGIATASPTVTSINPNSGLNNGSVNITSLAGTGFQAGTTVKLTKFGQSDITGTGVSVVSSTEITCIFDLTSAETGEWNVVVTNPDSQSGVLANGFSIVADPNVTHDVALISLTASPNPASKRRNVTFSYTVKNLGNVTENNLIFVLSYNGLVLGTPQIVGSLAAGQETTKTTSVKVPRRQSAGDYLITGTVSTVAGETNTSNNSATVKVTVK